MSRSTRRTAKFAALLLGVTTVVGVLPGPTPVEAADPVVINLVTVNDFHGRIEQDGAAAGAARLAGAVNQIRAVNPNTVFAAAGDLIGASTFTSFIQKDEPTIAALNAAGLDVSAAGNHEFDQGWDDLNVRVQNLADWEYIAANVFLAGTDDTALAESWTTTLPNGVTMGFVGAVTEDLPSLVSPAGIAALDVRDIVDSVNAAADRLRDGNAANGEADIVILLVHEGAASTALEDATNPGSAFGQIVNGVDGDVDAIVSGHTHLPYNHVINGRPVISSGQYGERFSDMVITYDPDDGIVSMVNTIYTTAVALPLPIPPGQPTHSYNYPEDPTVKGIVAAATAAAAGPGNVVVGQVSGDFRRAQQPGIVNGQPGLVENRGGESTIGNFVADVQLWSIQQDAPADIAFMNPGGIRTDILFAPDGQVSYREAANVQPFANTLVSFDLTGAQVKAVLEQQWQDPAANRPSLKLGVNKELSYVYDPTAAQGSRVTRIVFEGQDLDPTATYRVVANSFLAAGGDNFTAFNGATNKKDTGKIDLQSMVDWFAANGTANPDYAQRAVGIKVTTNPNAVGEKLAVNLSSLDFSTVEPRAGTVNVTIGGEPLFSAAVDPTRLEKYDEIGRASGSGSVPTDVYGWQDLTIDAPTTGTTATLPVFLKAHTDPEIRPTSPSPKAGSTINLFVTIDSPLEITGSFGLLIDGVSAGTIAYEPNDEGEVKVKLAKTLTKGVHTIKVVYPGSSVLLSSEQSLTLTLK